MTGNNANRHSLGEIKEAAAAARAGKTDAEIASEARDSLGALSRQIDGNLERTTSLAEPTEDEESTAHQPRQWPASSRRWHQANAEAERRPLSTTCG